MADERIGGRKGRRAKGLAEGGVGEHRTDVEGDGGVGGIGPRGRRGERDGGVSGRKGRGTDGEVYGGGRRGRLTEG